MAATKEQPPIPPEETMWQQYSPHFELPLASATSVFLHGFVIGILAIGGLAVFFTANLEASKPVKMDVVMVEGGGTGFEGLSGESGSPGDPNAAPARTENVTPLPEQNNQPEFQPTPRPPMEEPRELGLPLIDDGAIPDSGELVLEMQKVLDDAQKELAKQMDLPPPLPVPKRLPTPKTSVAGSGNPKGTGGLGGAGGGTGLGKQKGPFFGKGGPPGGRKATDQEIKAFRWRFDLAGDPREHARKLAATGVIVAVPDPTGGFIIITDLNRRPVEKRRDALAAYKDAVKWYNTRPDSVQGLASELQLGFVPKYVVLLLPQDREQRIAQEEARYAQDRGRNVKLVQATWFDFRLMNGTYEPVVTKQQ
jgi:hypothetical protein